MPIVARTLELFQRHPKALDCKQAAQVLELNLHHGASRSSRRAIFEMLGSVAKIDTIERVWGSPASSS